MQRSPDRAHDIWSTRKSSELRTVLSTLLTPGRINLRGTWDAVRFLARGIYELYCRDNPNDPIPLVVDLGQHAEDKERKARTYEVPEEEAISLEAFESSVRDFLVALSLAGISLPPPPDVEHILDLFRR